MLDRQLETGIELLRQGHQVQVRALEMVWMTNPAGPEVVDQPAAPPAPAPDRQRKREAWALYNEVYDALDKLGPEFVRSDVCRVLGYEPDRTSLQRALKELEGEGMIALGAPGSGRIPARWLKVAQADSAAAQGS